MTPKLTPEEAIEEILLVATLKEREQAVADGKNDLAGRLDEMARNLANRTVTLSLSVDWDLMQAARRFAEARGVTTDQLIIAFLQAAATPDNKGERQN